MICNGYHSSNYLYFKVTNEFEVNSCFSVFSYFEPGKIYKIPKNVLSSLIFSECFFSCFQKSLDDFEINLTNLKEPFNIISLIESIPVLKVNRNCNTNFYFESKEYCVIDSWLKEKMNSQEMYISGIFNRKTIQERNQEVFSYVTEEERIPIDFIEKQLISENNTLPAERKHLSIYKFITGTPIHFWIYKGEELDLKNPTIALALLNQNFLKFLGSSIEILGAEKEKKFIDDFKDYIPNSKRKYYKLKSDVKVTNIYKLKDECCLDRYNHNYKSLIVAGWGQVGMYKSNPLNYDADGFIKYFYVDYTDSIADSAVEYEILKIADCLSQEEAIKKYEEDLKAQAIYKKKQEALEYVKLHKNRYKKGANRTMTPVEFMEKEQARERKDLGMRLVRSLQKRKADLE